MGFVYDDQQYRLTFADGRYAGLKVTMTGLTVGELLDTMDNSAGLEIAGLANMSHRDIAANAPAIAAKFRELHESTTGQYIALANHLVSWNVETKDGEPVPPTYKGILTQSAHFVKDIITAWRTGITGVDSPLDPPSNDGEPSPELSLPMEPLSPNQGS